MENSTHHTETIQVGWTVASLREQMPETLAPVGMRQVSFPSGHVAGSLGKNSAPQYTMAHSSARNRRGISNLGRHVKSSSKEMGNDLYPMKGFQGTAFDGVGSALKSSVAEFSKIVSNTMTVVQQFVSVMDQVNSTTEKSTDLAHSVGISADAFDAWTGIAKEAGFEGEHVVHWIGEMTNNLAESTGVAKATPIKKALQTIGLEFESISKLSPEEQFRSIAMAIKEMNDQQKAISAVKPLIGDDAGSFFTYLRSRKEGLNELIEQQRRLISLTDEGRDGARKYNDAVEHFSTAIGSAAAEIFGLVGGALAPYIEDIAPQIATWVNTHRDAIKEFGQSIGKALPTIGDFMLGLLNVAQKVGGMVGSLAEMVGGFENLFWIVGGAMAVNAIGNLLMFGRSVYSAGATLTPVISNLLPALVAGIRAVGAAVMANPIGAAIGLAVLAVYRLISVWDELKASFATGGILSAIATYVGFGDSPEETKKEQEAKPVSPEAPLLPPQGRGTTNVQQQYSVAVHAAPGQDPDEIAEAVMRKMQDRNSMSDDMLYDGAY